MRGHQTRKALAVLLLSGIAPFADAALIELTFNNILDGDANGTVQTKVNQELAAQAAGLTVKVTGAKGEKNYTGDQHVVGPLGPNGITVPLSLTLGSSDLGVPHALPWDTYLVNTTTLGNDRIVMEFSKEIYGVSFDFQIFPHGGCADGGTKGCKDITAGSWPDFTLRADEVEVFRVFGLDPSNLASVIIPSPITVVAPKAPGLLESPFSDNGVAGNEKAPQLLALSGWWAFPDGVTKLEFVDWPRQIGIDNLRFSVPEPGTIALLAVGLAGIRLRRRAR